MPSNKCSVLGCESERMVKKHVFPLIDVDYDLWVLRTGNKKLEGLSKSYVRKTFLVCCNHFSSSCYSTGTKRLKRGSMPTLLLPTIISNRYVQQQLANKSIEIVNVSCSSPLPLPTCDESFDIVNVSCPSPLPLPTCDESFDIVNVSCPSPLALPLFDESTDFMNVSCSSPLASCLSDISLAPPLVEFPNTVNAKKKKSLYNIGMRRVADLTPRKKKLYTVAKKLIKKVNCMTKKNVSFKQQLKFAKKFVIV